jgi:hypothetical protein
MVLIVRCPYTREAGFDPPCGYFQMIDDQRCGTEVKCILCGRGIQVGSREEMLSAPHAGPEPPPLPK